MYKLNFTLKQHTPLIHFQHDQAGATLRATEVKPKLDRFILMTLGKEALPNEADSEIVYKKGIDIAKDKGWLVGNGDKPALDYKMRVEAKGEASCYFITSNPISKNNDESRKELTLKEFNASYINRTQYFGNNKNLKKGSIEAKEEVKLGIKHEQLELTVLTFNYSLFDCLMQKDKDILRAFFVNNNFGTRQTKGFGCFLPESVSDTDIKRYLSVDSNVLGVFKKHKKGNFEDKLHTVGDDYSLLKRGKSHDGYQKSKLWDYLCNRQSLNWEKKKIKEHIKANDSTLFSSLKCGTSTHRIEICPKPDNNGYQYIRALLGLAEQYEFVKNDDSRLTVKIVDSSPAEYKMERFKSPIRYIITEDAIYLVAYKITGLLQSYRDDRGNVMNRNITFKIGNGIPDFNLTIPQNFDLLDFLTKKSGYTKI